MMRILLLTHSFNSLTQRLFAELADDGHTLSVEFDIADSVAAEAVALFAPDVVLAPFLKRAVPASIWSCHPTLIVHPGIVGDRGPSALDWAIGEGAREWGVTVLQAEAEMDAGPVWATRRFAMRAATKASLYRNEVTTAALAAVREALARVPDWRAGRWAPTPLAHILERRAGGCAGAATHTGAHRHGAHVLEHRAGACDGRGAARAPGHGDAPGWPADVRGDIAADIAAGAPLGRLRPPMRQADRAIDWARDATDTVLAKIRAADGFPGVADVLFGVPCHLFDAHRAAAGSAAGAAPGEVVARRDGALLRATVDGAVWIGHVRRGDGEHRFKLPAAVAFAAEAAHLPERAADLSAGVGEAVALGAAGDAGAAQSAGAMIDCLAGAGAPDDAAAAGRPRRALPGGDGGFERCRGASGDVLQSLCDDGAELAYRESADGRVGFLAFEFYNGAMSTAQCERLAAAIAFARTRPTRVLVLAGGRDFWSNGIHLNTIEAAASPADESWANINAMNDVCLALLTLTDRITVAALRGNAGAGGCFVALAADHVWAREGVILNPHYKNMGNLYGSEYWTYLLPRRVGEAAAHRIMQARPPLLARHAAAAGLIDAAFGEDVDAFARECEARAAALAAAPELDARIAAKAARRAADEAAKPLAAWRAGELAQMRRNFYGFDPSYHVARYHFVMKSAPSWTPRHLARHRELAWRVPPRGGDAGGAARSRAENQIDDGVEAACERR
jgi:putative two-component system hydrogenase maturation factor HypX/HoxX